MTITSSSAKTGPYTGDGETVDFDYDFLILDDGDIVVTVTVDDVDTVQTLTTHYTVSGAGNTSGGTVTFVSAPADGASVTLTRSTQIIQEVDLQNRGAVVPETLEQALDRLTIVAQDLKEKIARAPLASVTESSPIDYADVVAAQTAAEAAQTAAEDAAAAALAAENSLLEWKGPWTTAAAYAPSDVVSNAGSSYVCVEAHTSAGAFSTDLSAGKWQVAAAKGDSGPGSGDLLAANDLSDLNDADTALSNLGGGTTGIALFKDTTAAAARTELGLGGLATLDILDEDDMATDSATRPPSQQSVAAYVNPLFANSWERYTISGSPTELVYDDTNDLFTTFNGDTYTAYLSFRHISVLPSTDNVTLSMRASIDGGSTWLSTLGDYKGVSGGTLIDIDNVTICTSIGSATNEGIHRGTTNIWARTGAATVYYFSSSYVRVSPDGVTYNFFSNRGIIDTGGSALNGIRFYLSSGNFASGIHYVDLVRQTPSLF